MKIGTLVECVDSRFNAEQLEKIPNCPQKGNHYMIREIIEFGYLVGEIHENGLIEFLPKIPSLLETSRGGKRRKRKSKRKSKRNGKRTKRNKKIYKNKKLT